jgi:hypothetical protein
MNDLIIGNLEDIEALQLAVDASLGFPIQDAPAGLGTHQLGVTAHYLGILETASNGVFGLPVDTTVLAVLAEQPPDLAARLTRSSEV